MQPDAERSGPRPGSRPDNHSPDAIVADARDSERARRIREWARRQLDELFLHEPPSMITTADVLSLAVAPWETADAGDFWHDVGMDLGMPERRAAGLALLGRRSGT